MTAEAGSTGTKDIAFDIAFPNDNFAIAIFGYNTYVNGQFADEMYTLMSKSKNGFNFSSWNTNPSHYGVNKYGKLTFIAIGY